MKSGIWPTGIMGTEIFCAKRDYFVYPMESAHAERCINGANQLPDVHRVVTSARSSKRHLAGCRIRRESGRSFEGKGLQTGRFEIYRDQDNSSLQSATPQNNGLHALLRTGEDLVPFHARTRLSMPEKEEKAGLHSENAA